MKDQYKVTLTNDEIRNILDALNYYSVKYFHKKMDNAEKKSERIAYEFWEKEWQKNLDLFVKMCEVKNK